MRKPNLGMTGAIHLCASYHFLTDRLVHLLVELPVRTTVVVANDLVCSTFSVLNLRCGRQRGLKYRDEDHGKAELKLSVLY